MRTQFSMMLAAAALTMVGATANASVFRYADTVVSYDITTGTTPGTTYEISSKAIGQPSTAHTLLTPDNTSVTSLGNGGSITLVFDQPITNQVSSTVNPYGYEMLIWGNSFFPGSLDSGEHFNEPGYVEVAYDDGSGGELTWYLILGRRFVGGAAQDAAPGSLVAGDTGNSTTLLDGYADVTPMNGGALASLLSSGDASEIILDDPATVEVEGLGGTGIDLARAVVQASQGVPLLDAGLPVFANLAQVNRVRITDAILDDRLVPSTLGYVSTEIDGVLVLPNFVPEPASVMMLAAAGVLTLARRRRLLSGGRSTPCAASDAALR